MPTQLALVFFGILHVPLNVPALGVSLSEDNVKLDRELIAHGISNLAAGFTGTVPNYLCYVNTVLCESPFGFQSLTRQSTALGEAPACQASCWRQVRLQSCLLVLPLSATFVCHSHWRFVDSSRHGRWRSHFCAGYRLDP